MKTDFLTLFDSREDQEIIPEEAFAGILAPFAGPLLSLSPYIEEVLKAGDGKLLNLKFLANVIKHSSDVEHFLDRYRARNNRNWVYFRELVATAKNFGKAAFLLEDLRENTRLKGYHAGDASGFGEDVETVFDFFAEILGRDFVELKTEAGRLQLTSLDEQDVRNYGAKLPNKIILPHTIEESPGSDKSQTVRKLVHRYADFVKEARFLEEMLRDGVDLAAHIPVDVNEGTLRRLGTRLHNFQSWYDSYIEQSRIESEMPELKTLHEAFPVQLNLFKIATILIHYYERHLMLPSSPVVENLRRIVPPRRLIDEAFHFSLRSIVELFHVTGGLAEAVLNRLVDRATVELPIPRDLGFHARPSARVAKVVQHYGADVKMLVDDQVFDAGSILELLSAGGYILTKHLDRILFQGDKQALNDLKILADFNYGETPEGKDVRLPDSLSYLRQES